MENVLLTQPRHFTDDGNAADACDLWMQQHFDSFETARFLTVDHKIITTSRLC